MINNFENTKDDEKHSEKICSFYASDYHFELISLPYIAKEIKQNNKVVIFTENDLENTVEKVLKSINMPDGERQNLFGINWSGDTVSKMNELEQVVSRNLKTTVFIKGGKDYIQKMNSYIQANIDSKYVKSIDCYPVDEVEKDIPNITCQYDGVLSTSGKIDLR